MKKWSTLNHDRKRLKWYQITSLEFSIFVTLLIFRTVILTGVFIMSATYINDAHIFDLKRTFAIIDSISLGSNLVSQFRTIVVALWFIFLFNLLQALKFRRHHWLKLILLYGAFGFYLWNTSQMIFALL